jgi:membrane protein DedA with SNARE-associated domain
MPETLINLLGQYGYAVLALTVFFMNAGIPLPGHAAYIAACALSAQGTLSLPLVFLAGTVPAFLGAWAGFTVGRRGGRNLVEKLGPRVGLSVERREAIERFFARHGGAAIFFTRFVIVIRTFGSVFAGMSRFPTRRFLVVTAAGAVAWGAVYAAVGTVFRQTWNLVEDWLGATGLIGLGALALAGIAHIIWRRRRKRTA